MCIQMYKSIDTCFLLAWSICCRAKGGNCKQCWPSATTYPTWRRFDLGLDADEMAWNPHIVSWAYILIDFPFLQPIGILVKPTWMLVAVDHILFLGWYVALFLFLSLYSKALCLKIYAACFNWVKFMIPGYLIYCIVLHHQVIESKAKDNRFNNTPDDAIRVSVLVCTHLSKKFNASLFLYLY